MPQISIIIPIYNAAKTLEDCLQSIFSQTFKHYEIIAVNDGSTDSSAKILEKYKNKLTLITQKNEGAASARNAGAKAARGEFIIFCDSDVTLKPEALELMLKTLRQSPKSSYVYSGFKFGQKTFKLWPFSQTKLKQMPYIHTTSLIHKKHFPGFDKKLKRFQDWDLWLTMMKRGYTGKFIPRILFTVKPGGTMSSWLPKFAYSIPFFKKVKKYKEAEKIIKQKHNL